MTFLYVFSGIALLLIWLLFSKFTFSLYFCENLYLSFEWLFLEKEMILFGREKPDEEETPLRPPKKAKKDAVKPGIKEILPVVKETLANLFEKSKKHIRLEKYILKLRVASEDPAKTGILYGAASGGAAALLALMENLPEETKKNAVIYSETVPDFIGETSDIYLHVVLSTRLWRGLSLALSLANGYGEYKKLKSKGKSVCTKSP